MDAGLQWKDGIQLTSNILLNHIKTSYIKYMYLIEPVTVLCTIKKRIFKATQVFFTKFVNKFVNVKNHTPIYLHCTTFLCQVDDRKVNQQPV